MIFKLKRLKTGLSTTHDNRLVIKKNIASKQPVVIQESLLNTLFLIIFFKMDSNRSVDELNGLILPPIDLSDEIHSKNILFVGVSDEPRITATIFGDYVMVRTSSFPP